MAVYHLIGESQSSRISPVPAFECGWLRFGASRSMRAASFNAWGEGIAEGEDGRWRIEDGPEGGRRDALTYLTGKMLVPRGTGGGWMMED
jgi:hypothetical protein